MASSESEMSVNSNQPSTTTTQASSSLVKNDCIDTGEGESSGNVGRQVSTKNKEAGKNFKAKTFKSRATLDKELVEKSQELDSLQRQVDEVQESLRRKQDEETSTKKLYEETKAELAKAQEKLTNFADLKNRLSEENYDLREKIVKQGEEIERLKETKESSKNVSSECKAPMHKILRKENVELHYEKEQLKTERDRLRQTVKEKQDQYDKMSGSLGDVESHLLKAKRELEDRAKASSRLEDRLTKTDRELNNWRERFAKLEKQNRRPSEHVRGEKPNESENDKNTFNKQEYHNKKHVTFLQKKEEKLLDDRRKLETEANKLTTKISELEGQLRNCRSEKGPTNERGSQTELGPGPEMMSKSRRERGASNAEESGGEAPAVRKCRGIVTSLGKFFEELIQNNQESPSGGSRGRRTAIAARRANELLHELSMSIERIVSPKKEQRGDGGHVSGCTQQGTQTSGHGRKSEANSSKGTLWDRLSHAVANHEFAFEQISPTKNNQNAEAANDKEKEVKRAEIALQKLYKAGSSGASNANEKLTKEDASRLMDANRRQTEIVVRELLREHHGEIRALVENAQQATPVQIVTSGLCDTNEEDSGQNEASLAVQELDNFKTRTAKVQSLILKMQAGVESAKNDRESVYCQLQILEDELRQKEALLQAKSQELRRRHCKALEMEKSLNAQIESLTKVKEKVGNENSRLHEVCRQKDLQILGKIQEVKALRKEIGEREKAHQQNLGKMKTKVEEAWNQYTSVKTRAEKRTAEFNEAAEKLKVSQGYLLDLWQTLKTVDNVVEANENDEL